MGAAVIVFVVIFLPNTIARSDPSLKDQTWWQIFRRFNPVGTAVLLTSIICLLLALQWGGTQDWGSARVIATLVVFGVTIIVWGIMQYVQGEEATVPWTVIKQRTVAGATIYTLLGSSSLTIVIFYLPIWYFMLFPNLKTKTDTKLKVPNHQGR